MKPETLSEQLFFVTVHITAKNASGSWTGTGFLYRVHLVEGPAIVLVTNKHVLQDADSITVRMVCADQDGGANLGTGTQVEVNGFSDDTWVGHPDPKVDVGVFPMGQVFDQMANQGDPPFFRALDPQDAYSLARHDLDAVEDVAFIGYPRGLYDTRNLTPIMRRGTTATHPAIDYRGEPSFLIDASVFPGSSGSPVVISDSGSYRTKQGIVIGSRLIFLGVLAAVHVRQVQGTVTQLPAKLVATFPEPIDLGIVYRAETIETCIEELLARTGSKRAAAS